MKNTTDSRFDLRTAVLAGLLAGTLDALAAVIILAKGNAAAVFRYIASAVFGPAAFTEGPGMIAWGLLFHYIIALCWTVAFFLLRPRLALLRRSVWLSAVLWGLFVWGAMNLVVVPMTRIKQAPLTLEGCLMNASILIVCIGLPAAWMAARSAQKTIH